MSYVIFDELIKRFTISDGTVVEIVQTDALLGGPARPDSGIYFRVSVISANPLVPCTRDWRILIRKLIDDTFVVMGRLDVSMVTDRIKTLPENDVREMVICVNSDNMGFMMLCGAFLVDTEEFTQLVATF